MSKLDRCGHLHLVEDFEFNGLRLIGSGSVGGQRWGGSRHGTPEGFGILDCRAGGPLRFE